MNRTREQHELTRELNLIKKLIHLSETEQDENKLLNEVSINVCHELDVEWCFIYKYNPVAGYGSEEPARYDLKAVNIKNEGVSIDEFEKKHYFLGEGLTGSVLREEGIFVTSDNVFKDPRSSGKNLRPFKDRSIEESAFLGYPIKFEEPLIPTNKIASKLTRTIGIITLGRGKKFGNKEKETVKIISTFIGKELERRRLIVQQELFHNYTTLLNLLPEELAICETEDQVLTVVGKFVPKYLKEQYFSIFRLDTDRILRMKSPKQYTENMDIPSPTFSIDEDEGFTNKIIRDGASMFKLDFDQGKKACRNFWTSIVGTDDRYFIGVPIKHPMKDSEYYGVFTLNGRKPAIFDPHFCESVTVEIVKSVAAQISSALSRTCDKWTHVPSSVAGTASRLTS